jgi:adenosylcobyric acid synthase
MLDLLGDLVEAHLDTDALWRLIEQGTPRGLPVLSAGGS